MRAWLLAALVAAGCAGQGGGGSGIGGVGGPGGDPRVAACRTEAASSPEVVAVRRRQPPAGNADAHGRWREALAAAESIAYSACLRRAGVVAGGAGGVEVPGALSPDLEGIPGRAPAPAPSPAASGY